MHHLAASLYRLGAGIVVGAMLWMQLGDFGWEAWRLAETWILVLAVFYFVIAAIVAFWRGSHGSKNFNFCPMLQGAVITLGIGILVLWLAYQDQHLVWPGAQDNLTWFRLALVPVLAILDWVIFTKKGGWQLCYPWYWVGLVVIFACAILLTAGFVPDMWQYPYFFLNYPVNSIEYMFWWMLLISVVTLVIGYTIVTLDYLVSGKIGERIVMPRIKTIIIEEELPEDPAPAAVSKPQPKPLTQTKPQSKVPQLQANKNKTQPKSQSAKPQPAKTQPKSVRKNPTTVNDVVKPVEGLKDRKSAQKLHHSNRSKSEIIADMRLKVAGPKKSHQGKPTSKKS